MFITTINNVLNAETLAKTRQIIQASEFTDGRISGGTATNKKNLELAPETEKYVDVLKIIEQAVRSNVEFNLTAFPRAMTRPIISRYNVGMFYKEHVDLPVMGFMTAGRGLASAIGSNYVRSDLSMTLFLSDPSTYDGGELSFDSPFGGLKIKLDAGSAVVYPTGARHQVLPVTRGVRQAAIFWIQTMFPVEAHRQAVHSAHRIMKRLGEVFPGSDEFVMAQDNFYNLSRIFAQV
jgi:PKHD-type hydroxylase